MNNTLRQKIGIKPLLESWKKINIKGIHDDLYISEKNVVEKAISQNNENKYYLETDLAIQLNEEGKLVTKAGKIKNLTSSVYESIKPKDISISILENEIRIGNHSNNLMLIDEYGLELKNLEEAFNFINKYLEDDRKYFIEHIKSFKSSQKTSRVRIKSGDIFRVPIKGKKFIFGQVISTLRESVKMELPVLGNFDTSGLKINVFDPNPFLFPLLVRFSIQKTDNPFLEVEDLNRLSYSASTIIGDYSLRHSNYKIIGNREIDLSTVDLPMKVGTKFYKKPLFHYFNWGAGIITLKVNEKIEKLISENPLKRLTKIRMRQHESIELFINHCQEGKLIFGNLETSSDLRDDNLKELKYLLLEQLGLSQNITYEEFAQKYGFLSIKKLIE